MIQMRWEHFTALLLLVGGGIGAGGAWLSFGSRTSLVNERAEQLGGLVQELAAQLAIERIVSLVGGALVMAALVLWVLGTLRGRAAERATLAEWT